MKNSDLDLKIRQNLSSKAWLSDESESLLFMKAENLLSVRRDRLAMREVSANARNKHSIFGEAIQKVFEILATHADMPAAVTTAFVLLLAIFIFPHRSGVTFKMSFSDLPDLPKTNDFSARYDAQLLAERIDYEREVEDAHRRTSGGI